MRVLAWYIDISKRKLPSNTHTLVVSQMWNPRYRSSYGINKKRDDTSPTLVYTQPQQWLSCGAGPLSTTTTILFICTQLLYQRANLTSMIPPPISAICGVETTKWILVERLSRMVASYKSSPILSPSSSFPPPYSIYIAMNKIEQKKVNYKHHKYS